jgi:adenine/guanine phosphoribosyltransferase-like PRPP-binding protein
MLNAASAAEERVTTMHRAKLAYVYVRQSSPGQVRQHQESTELQYRLVERAILLGWPRERVLVIDDDLGKSGASSGERQRLIPLIQVRLYVVGLGCGDERPFCEDCLA